MSTILTNVYAEAHPANIRSDGPFSATGERTMPQVVDQVANIQPGAIWVSFQLSDNSGRFRDVTFKELTHRVNYMAW
jgi:hypothetical protein